MNNIDYPCRISNASNVPDLSKMERVGTESKNRSYNYETITEVLTCPVCVRIMLEPVTLPCGHSFCKSPCLRGALQEQPACPVCRTAFFGDVQRSNPSYTIMSLIETLVHPEELSERKSESVIDEVELSSSRLGLFFLPDCTEGTLMPGNSIQLSVWEPRYLILINRCLDSGMYFGIQSSNQSVGGVGMKIESVRRLLNNRMLITASAIMRYTVCAAPELEPNAMGLHYAHVSFFSDVPKPLDVLKSSGPISNPQQTRESTALPPPDMVGGIRTVSMDFFSNRDASGGHTISTTSFLNCYRDICSILQQHQPKKLNLPERLLSVSRPLLDTMNPLEATTATTTSPRAVGAQTTASDRPETARNEIELAHQGGIHEDRTPQDTNWSPHNTNTATLSSSSSVPSASTPPPPATPTQPPSPLLSASLVRQFDRIPLSILPAFLSLQISSCLVYALSVCPTSVAEKLQRLYGPPPDPCTGCDASVTAWSVYATRALALTDTERKFCWAVAHPLPRLIVAYSYLERAALAKVEALQMRQKLRNKKLDGGNEEARTGSSAFTATSSASPSMEFEQTTTTNATVPLPAILVQASEHGFSLDTESTTSYSIVPTFDILSLSVYDLYTTFQFDRKFDGKSMQILVRIGYFLYHILSKSYSTVSYYCTGNVVSQFIVLFLLIIVIVAYKRNN